MSIVEYIKYAHIDLFAPFSPLLTPLQDGRTPLHLATVHGNLSAVKALLEMGGDPNATDQVREGKSPPSHLGGAWRGRGISWYTFFSDIG